MLDMLYKLSLQEVFGLRYLNEYDLELSIEIIEGNTNIMMLCRSVADLSLIKHYRFSVLEITIAATVEKFASNLV